MPSSCWFTELRFSCIICSISKWLPLLSLDIDPFGGYKFFIDTYFVMTLLGKMNRLVSILGTSPVLEAVYRPGYLLFESKLLGQVSL